MSHKANDIFNENLKELAEEGEARFDEKRGIAGEVAGWDKRLDIYAFLGIDNWKPLHKKIDLLK